MAKALTRDQKIFRLGKIITDRATVLLGKEKISTESPEYWGIDFGIQYAERRYGIDIADDCLDGPVQLWLDKNLPERSQWEK